METKTTSLAVIAVLAGALVGCGQATMSLYVIQQPMSGLPECGQEIYTLAGRKTNVPEGYITSSAITTVTDELPAQRFPVEAYVPHTTYTNIYRLEVAADHEIEVGTEIVWSNGRGVVVKVTQLPLAVGSL